MSGELSYWTTDPEQTDSGFQMRYKRGAAKECGCYPGWKMAKMPNGKTNGKCCGKKNFKKAYVFFHTFHFCILTFPLLG